MGRQGRVAIIYGIGFWMCGVPIGGVLCFFMPFGIYGLWYGLIVGLVVVSVASGFVLAMVDFKQEALRALETAKIPVDMFPLKSVAPL